MVFFHHVVFRTLCTLWNAPIAVQITTTLELDELWSFVLKKANDSWMWIALCRKTRQVVGYAIGDRSKRMCQRLWESIPDLYRQGHCFTDFWAAYKAVIAFRATHSCRK